MNECKIVEDLIPLYAEDLTSPETKGFIDAHCAECDACAKLKARAGEAVPEQLPEPGAVKKALWGNTLKMIFMGIGIFVVAIALIYFGITKLDAYMQWKDGRTPVEQVVKAPVGNGKVTLVDWEASGYRIGNAANEGTLIYIKQEHVVEGDWKDGGSTITERSISESGYAEPWENVRVEWAPNGTEFMLTADLPEGGTGMFVYTYESWFDEDGGHHGVSKFLPGTSGRGLVDILMSACAENQDFPTGWETVAFTFHQWQEDSETITFVYETDNGYRGILDYHFPTETITKVN